MRTHVEVGRGKGRRCACDSRTFRDGLPYEVQISYAEGRGTSFSARKCGRPRSGRARVLVLEDERAFRVFGLLVG